MSYMELMQLNDSVGSHVLGASRSNNTSLAAPETYFWMDLATFLLILLTNGVVLYVFAVNRSLRTSFAMYVISLLLANMIAYCFFLGAFHTIRHPSTYRVAWPILCSIYLYGEWCLTGAISFTHALIAINRVWAVGLPLSYRSYHTKKLAVKLCVLVWMATHVVCLPVIILDATLYYKPVEIHGCGIDSGELAIAVTFLMAVVYIAPVVVLVVCYAFLLYKATQRAREKIQKIRQIQSKLKASDFMQLRRTNSQEGSHGFLAMTFLTGTAVCCWWPSDIGWIIASFSDEDPRAAWLREGGFYIYCFQAIFDPIAFLVALPDVRAALFKRRTTSEVFYF